MNQDNNLDNTTPRTKLCPIHGTNIMFCACRDNDDDNNNIKE